MMYVRIRSYKSYEKSSLAAEHLYVKTGTLQDAIDRFLHDMPEQKQCIIVAEDYDSEDPKNEEHFRVCKECGCAHFW